MRITVPIDTLNPEEPNAVRVDGGIELTVCKLGERWFALESECPHKGANLYDGEIVGDLIVCPLHHFKFKIETGRCQMPKHLRAVTYPVVADGGVLAIELPEASPPAAPA